MYAAPNKSMKPTATSKFVTNGETRGGLSQSLDVIAFRGLKVLLLKNTSEANQILGV